MRRKFGESADVRGVQEKRRINDVLKQKIKAYSKP